MNRYCIISELREFSNLLILLYSGKHIKSAWLENADKHFPDVFPVISTSLENMFIIPNMTIEKIIEKQIIVKLVVSDDYEKLSYSINENIFVAKDLLGVSVGMNANSELTFSPIGIKNKSNFEKIDYESSAEEFSLFLKRRGIPEFIKSDKKNTPLSIVVIGTCFARSIFRSDSYFNPNYKSFFNVKYTFFHNSLISLMSNPIIDKSYIGIKDLAQDEVLRYIKNEFQKNIFAIIDSINPDYIIMDNYIDCNRPLVQISDKQFLTYNTYFSKSIYKKNFIDCKIFFPFEEEYKELYKKHVKLFSNELKSRNFDKRLILLGSRLCESKINTLTGEIKPWENPDYWIRPSNKNWDVMDRVLLEEIPNAVYIDMRKTKWMSDVNCTTIKGGASPSHYQSEFYKEVFEKIKAITIK